MLQIDDEKRVRTLTLNRPEALNAFNEALYDATAEALLAAADDPEVAVVLLTGTGRGFSAGTDLAEMQARITDPHFTTGKHSFPGLIDALSAFPKPLICAVNGLSLIHIFFSMPSRTSSAILSLTSTSARCSLVQSITTRSRSATSVVSSNCRFSMSVR